MKSTEIVNLSGPLFGGGDLNRGYTPAEYIMPEYFGGGQRRTEKMKVYITASALQVGHLLC